jgi:hypothetical protein
MSELSFAKGACAVATTKRNGHRRALVHLRKAAQEQLRILASHPETAFAANLSGDVLEAGLPTQTPKAAFSSRPAFGNKGPAAPTLDR